MFYCKKTLKKDEKTFGDFQLYLLYLHPLLQGIFEGMKGQAGGTGKKSLKKDGPGVGGEKKLITFAARFGRNGD